MFNGASNWEKYTELVLWWNYMPPWSVEAFCKTHCSLTWIFMKGASSDEYHTKVTEISHVKARRSLSKKAKNCKITYSQKNAVNCWHNDKTAPGVCQLQSRRKHTVGRDNQRASQNRTRNREYNSLLRHNELLPVRQINECRLLPIPPGTIPPLPMVKVMSPFRAWQTGSFCFELGCRTFQRFEGKRILEGDIPMGIEGLNFRKKHTDGESRSEASKEAWVAQETCHDMEGCQLKRKQLFRCYTAPPQSDRDILTVGFTNNHTES